MAKTYWLVKEQGQEKMSLLLQQARSTIIGILHSGGPTWRYSLMVTMETEGSRLLIRFSGYRSAVPSAQPPPYYSAGSVASLPLEAPGFSLRVFACGLLFHFLPSSHEQQSAPFPQQAYSLPNLASPPISIPRAGAVDLFISMVLKAYDNIQQKMLNV